MGHPEDWMIKAHLILPFSFTTSLWAVQPFSSKERTHNLFQSRKFLWRRRPDEAVLRGTHESHNDEFQSKRMSFHSSAYLDKLLNVIAEVLATICTIKACENSLKKRQLGSVTHVCNPSYLADWDGNLKFKASLRNLVRCCFKRKRAEIYPSGRACLNSILSTKGRKKERRKGSILIIFYHCTWLSMNIQNDS